MWYSRFLLLSAIMVVTGQLHSGEQQAIEAHNKQDYMTAMKEFLPLAKAGNVQAQMLLGLMYDNGLGNRHDYSLAMHWYKKVAAQGSARAMFNVGQLYEDGLGVSRDIDMALTWYARAAESGYAEAQYRYGMALSEEKSPLRDLVAAYKWLALAAAQKVAGAYIAASARDQPAEEMSDEAIVAAMSQALQWQKRQQAAHEGKNIEF